jgi:hypothetical protein
MCCCGVWNASHGKHSLDAACGAGEYAPDKIRSLGTAGAMAGGVRCVGGGGERRAVETTGQKMAFGAAHYSGRDCLRRAAPGGIID